MAIFDPYITSIAEYVKELRNKSRHIRERVFSSVPESLANPLPTNSNSSSVSSIVLKSDTFLELGSPAAGSCAITLYTDNPELLVDGKITLVGPDVKESPTALLPFAQVIMMGGKELNDNDYYQLRQYQPHHIEGYMVKSTPENVWGRISREAVRQGFNFEFLGRTLMSCIKTELRKVDSVEILFITSSREDVMELHKIGKPARDLAQNIKAKIWSERGVDITQCKPGGHCGLCADKSVCDDIKKIGIERRKLK